MRIPIVPVAWIGLLLLTATFTGCQSPSPSGPDSAASGPPPPPSQPGDVQVERVTTVVPFPRGLVLRNGRLFVLARGRVRGAGGVANDVDDRAGTIFVVDPSITQPIRQPEASDAVRHNGEVFAAPTDPPFRLYDRTSDPPRSDTRTDRPYCTLRWHEATQSFYVCAFSGIDRKGRPSFSKNRTDALLRYDLRTQRWHDVDRHDADSGAYPHHDPATHDPPHGWLEGPDNCLAVGNWLYAVAKDNNTLVAYDLATLVDDPHAPPPGGRKILGARITVRDPDGGTRERTFYGHSMLARHEDWLYLGFRTTSEIIRFRLGRDGLPVQPIIAEVVARFEPWDPEAGTSANLTDMDVDAQGRLYVVSAQPSRIWRVTPRPGHVFDATDGRNRPWADMAALTGNPTMKSENVLVDRATGTVYVTAGDAYGQGYGIGGAVYRVTEAD